MIFLLCLQSRIYISIPMFSDSSAGLLLLSSFIPRVVLGGKRWFEGISINIYNYTRIYFPVAYNVSVEYQFNLIEYHFVELLNIVFVEYHFVSSMIHTISSDDLSEQQFFLSQFSETFLLNQVKRSGFMILNHGIILWWLKRRNFWSKI